ncbi:ceramide-1-phosphate transfer protein [Nephila pilipes]|uniref:Ceramide-1-phosphate transfer protein n=1 Tax=Nephila pilipes TaxID=299642 RepID=A0A8X6JFZ9_NEPPI|nr:ceramide-1-phosphate transfer protein [Nephila pilipes]
MDNANETNKTNEENSAETASDHFDIQLLYNSLEKCCEESNALDIEQYLIAFKELYRFFTLLGSVFGFVASDIISKINILEEYKKSDASDQYSTIQSMIEFETCNGITGDTTRPSGSRTLLRLHRSLEFIMSFMSDFSCADPDAKSSTIAQKCYNETLSKYHPWLIRKGATFAMYTLPARQQFIERVYGAPCDEATIKFYGKMMGDIANVSKKVYDETHKLFEANDLLNLP